MRGLAIKVGVGFLIGVETPLDTLISTVYGMEKSEFRIYYFLLRMSFIE